MLVNIFAKLVHIFAWELVSRTLKQVSRNLGPLWQPAFYNDTNLRIMNGSFQRKTKGQQLKGKIVSEFSPFSHFFTLFQNFPPRIFPFKTQKVLAQGEQKRRKYHKKNRANRCCTLVVARLSSSQVSMCFSTVSSRPCLETSPHTILRTPFAGHCLGALWGGKLCPAELSERVNRVLRTLSRDPPLPILQTPSAGHCLDTHGVCFWMIEMQRESFFTYSWSFFAYR